MFETHKITKAVPTTSRKLFAKNKKNTKSSKNIRIIRDESVPEKLNDVFVVKEVSPLSKTLFFELLGFQKLFFKVLLILCFSLTILGFTLMLFLLVPNI